MIADARDIPIKILNVTSPASEVLRQFEGKYKLRNYRGPITAVVVQCDGEWFSIMINVHVIDVATQLPVNLKVNKSYDSWTLKNADPKTFFEHALRAAFKWTHDHELDESFQCDGKFVTEPHS